MIELGNFEDLIINAVKADTTFRDNCISVFGKELTYFVDADITDAIKSYPFFTVYGIESNETKGQNPYYIVQFVIGVMYEKKADVLNGVSRYTDKKNLEKATLESLKLIEQDLRSIGINGSCNFSIVEKNMVLSPIGVADDIQSIVTLRIEERKTF